MRILLTGASGFIGRTLAARLTAEGHEVHAPVLPGELSSMGSMLPAVRWLDWDLSLAPQPEALPRRMDSVIHLAQALDYRSFPEKAREIFAVNCAATLGLLDYARASGAHRFLLASSGSVYRRARHPLTEDAPVEPPEFYSLSKHVAEQLTVAYRGHFAVTIARFFCVYGPGQRGRLIPNLIEKVRSGRPVTLAGENGMSMNPLYVDDAVEALVELIGLTGSSVLNVAGEEAVSIRRMALMIGEQLGRAPVFEAGGAEEGDLVGSIDALRKAIGFKPQVSFADGLRLTIAAGRA